MIRLSPNVYKWAAILILLITYGVGVSMWSTHRCESKASAAKIEVAEERTREIVREVEIRVPVVQVREVESTKQRKEIERLGVLLNEAINKEPSDPSCDLTDDELRLFQELGKATRPNR